MPWVGVVTNAGRDLFDEFIASGTSININVVKVGTGTVNTSAMRDSTDLVAQVTTGSIIGKDTVTGGVVVKLSVGPYTSGYTLKEIGIFATVTTGSTSSEVMIALLQNATGIEIPASSSFPDYLLVISTVLSVNNSDTLEITIDSTTSVLSYQGTSNAGKFLVVGDDGFVAPVAIPDAEGSVF